MSKIAGLTSLYELPFYLQERRIYNSEGHSWDPRGANIQLAVNDLPVRGGWVQLPDRVLHIDTEIVCPNPTVLRGVPGWPAFVSGTEIIADAPMTRMVRFNAPFSILRHVLLNGNGQGTRGLEVFSVDCKEIGNAITGCTDAIRLWNSNNWVVRNWLEDNGSGVWVGDGDTIRVIDNLFWSNTTDGDIYLYGVPSKLFVRDSRSLESIYFIRAHDNVTDLVSSKNNIDKASGACYRFEGNLSYARITDDIANGQAITPYFLETLTGKTVTDVKVRGCSLRNFATGIFNEAATGRVEKHCNGGYNPRGPIATPYPVAAGNIDDVAAAQAFPSSNTNYTVVGSPKLITIYGGTVTSISIDGTATGLTSGAFYLRPKQILNVVWTGQPSSIVYAL